MKHRVKGRKFSRVKNQRKALIKSLLDSLIIREKMTTTEAKAKELKSIIDKVIGKAKRKTEEGKMAMIREMSKVLSSRAVKKLSGEFIKKFESRKSGYTRVMKLGRRSGDSAKMAIIEFI
ncbi:MAG: 50S ribosomal protein L17 [bacterium]|nr:50S ribosomal protein L17 [bacterium]